MNLFVFGLGYTARNFIARYGERITRICGTSHSPDQSRLLEGPEVIAYRFKDTGYDLRILDELASADALLVSIPPNLGADPVLDFFTDAIRSARRLRWVGYLSTVDVYGDAQGSWVDESTTPDLDTPRSRHRLEAEQRWLRLGQQAQFSVQIFRLANVYGPGRNPLRQLAEGRAKRSVKSGQVLNRIHASDVAQVLMSSMERPSRSAIYNVADDEPTRPEEVIAFAASLLGREPLPATPFAEGPLPSPARSFYQGNNRVRNVRIKTDLGVTLLYPTYREGLRALVGDTSQTCMEALEHRAEPKVRSQRCSH
ncbi:NAD(P)-dependent oxidoreductase [Microvirga sp. KLBC 81]|uniref:SDR family oxidoreductase n=1 Tax=Microvirga sp. KLBC 81 TaxID=1862707 RepID=UPI000D5251B7|nr:SDR family oxidoreductase [Microvirga sp. KLBC 81]PVE24193.1 NAD(P)-dependent oxidoreductase [Microvirga sp. KLBC 81]